MTDTTTVTTSGITITEGTTMEEYLTYLNTSPITKLEARRTGLCPHCHRHVAIIHRGFVSHSGEIYLSGYCPNDKRSMLLHQPDLAYYPDFEATPE